MTFIPVDSSMVLGVRYEEKSQELEVIFRTGEKYRYLSVPRDEFDGLMSADSVGEYMHKRILGHYEFERMY